MTPITYRQVPPGTEDFEKMQAFARSFDHEVSVIPSGRVYELTKGDTVIGYSDHIFVPMVYPAFHPELTTPSDVRQVLTDWRGHSMIQYGTGYIAVPTERKTFSEQQMKKLGLRRMHREIFEIE